MTTHQVPPGTYLQPVPDHCDRITWRGQCLSLEHIVGASRSDASALLSQLKVVQFHMIRGDFDGNKRLQGEAIDSIQKTIDAAQARAALSSSRPGAATSEQREVLVGLAKESMRQTALADADAELLGIGFLVDGKRVHPSKVSIHRSMRSTLSDGSLIDGRRSTAPEVDHD